MMGIASMLISFTVAMVSEVDRCKVAHPTITDKAAIELSFRSQGCVPHRFNGHGWEVVR